MPAQKEPEALNTTSEKWVVYSWDGNHRTWHSWYASHSEEDARARAMELRSRHVRLMRVRTTIETLAVIDPRAVPES